MTHGSVFIRYAHPYRKIKMSLTQALPLTAIQKKYEITKEYLGKGAFGKVLTAKNVYTNREYAAKIVKRRQNNSLTLAKEIHAMETLKNSTGAVNVYDIYYGDDEMIFVMEKMNNCVFPYFDEYETREFVRSMLLAIHDVHSKGIIHADVKHDHFMKTDDGDLKLIDFGLSTSFYNSSTPVITRGLQGTLQFIAPELYINQMYPASDIWAVGIIAYHLLTGEFPFESNNVTKLKMKVLHDQVNMNYLSAKKHSVFAQKFCSDVLVKNPTNRPTAEELLDHCWFDAYIPKKNNM